MKKEFHFSIHHSSSESSNIKLFIFFINGNRKEVTESQNLLKYLFFFALLKYLLYRLVLGILNRRAWARAGTQQIARIVDDGHGVAAKSLRSNGYL